ncbi:MAG: ATP-dependent Clp protease adapter ClpS [Magnetococcales bacterium]|nr:ATP-dependent Clp protease adapter ClpS [Magnetococcales bacterium]
MSQHDLSEETLINNHTRLQEPHLFKVILLNDDFTPMEFVVDILMRFFNKSLEEATQVMLNVHHKGFGVCGLYTREIAETKVLQVNQHARQNQHPLKCRMEKN